METIFIVGKQMCGKTHHSKALAEFFGCKYIQDDYRFDGKKAIPVGSLVLTNEIPPAGFVGKVYTFEVAMEKAGLVSDKPIENQHRKIKGYRDLSQDEIDLMNRIKEKAEELNQLLDEADTILHELKNPVINQDGLDDVQRYLELAKTNLQQGFMWFVRAVARPNSF